MLPPPAVRGIYRTDSRARAAYAEAAGIYRIVPQAVCLPADVDDLRHLIRWAAEHRTSLIPRGAGSAMGGGNVGEGVMVDLGRMGGRRLEINVSARTATTSASVTLAELNAAAAPNGLRLPPDPSSGRWASLGGMVSTNAAGARSVRYGSVRSWVEGLRIVTADGEIVTLGRGKTPPPSAALARFDRDAAPAIAGAVSLIAARFPRTRKNSSGYALDAYVSSGDVLDLLIGSEGTLGIVTEIEWRLDTAPACRAGLRVSLRSLEELGPVVNALSSTGPSAVELLDRTFLDLVGSTTLSEAHLSDAEAVLLVELERDDEEALTEAVERASSAARPVALSIERGVSADITDRLWAIRHAASPILSRLPEGQRSLQVIEDGCVPVARMGEYIRAVRRAGAEVGIPAVMFGHAGDGHIHVNLLPDVSRSGWEAAIERVMDAVTETIVRLGGTLSGEHGDGRLRADALERVYGPEIVELFRRVKHSFDPLGIFNPGIILPCPEGPHAGAPPISRLKVGDSAVPLPDDLQRSLREIERTGGYGRSRLELAGELESGVGSQESGG
jgi:FAD/FMN-containing dehydrogenase